jgi:diguanylate cyclase (GGDEF)-like protein
LRGEAVSAAPAPHASRAVLRRASALAVGLVALAGLLAWGWAARHGASVGDSPLVVAVLVLASAGAGRLVIRVGPRLEYVPATPFVLLAGLVGGPLAGLAAGGGAGLGQAGSPWRVRWSRAGLTAVVGFAAGVAGEALGAGPGSALAAAAVAYGAVLAVGAPGRLLIVAANGPRPVGRTVLGATLADLLEGIVLVAPLAALVLSAGAGGAAVVAAAAGALVAGLAVALRLGRGREEELQAERSRARTDALTGAANRRALEEALGKEHARVLRGAQPAGVLLLDLDRFKTLNDRHGHEAGDDALVQVAGRLRAQLRSTDLVARWGGEEFVVLAPAVGDLGALEQYADRLRRIVGGEPYALRRTAVVLTTSIGATLLDGSASPQQALERADRALYDAKRTRDTTVVALPLGSTWRRRAS